MGIQADDSYEVLISFNKSFYVELKRILFKQGISVPAYLGYLVQLTSLGDTRMNELLSEARSYITNTETLEKSQKQLLHRTDDESLFNLIEESSPMKG